MQPTSEVKIGGRWLLDTLRYWCWLRW